VSTDKIAANAVTIAKLPTGATASTYLRGDGTWVTPTDNNTTYAGSTSVTLTSGTFQRAALTGDVTAAANNNATTIANNAVTSAKIADGTIATADLADNSVTSAKIADATIVAADIANTTITGAKLVNATVTATQLADNSVTSAKIANSAVTGAKIDRMAANSGDVLTYNGSSWAAAPASAGIPGSASTAGYIVVNYSGAPVTDALPTNCRVKVGVADGAFAGHAYDADFQTWNKYGAGGSLGTPSETSSTVTGVHCASRRCWLGTAIAYTTASWLTRMAIPVICW
jgi:hypothetical protein